jgi:hypothetical protein
MAVAWDPEVEEATGVFREDGLQGIMQVGQEQRQHPPSLVETFGECVEAKTSVCRVS